MVQLPENWEERTDPSSGRTYYVNVVTRASQWDPPVVVKKKNQTKTQQTPFSIHFLQFNNF